MQANYTWSHAQAHESDYYFNDAMADYGNSYYNRRNQFNAFGVWDLPFGRHHIVGGGAPGWENAVIGGWEISGNVTAETGLPFTPSYSLCTQDQDIDGQGGTLCRPNWNGASFQLGAQGFNPLTHNERFFPAFPTLAYAGATEGPYVRPLPGHFGNIFRDQLWGPGYFATNASMAKTIPLHERLSVQFTAQAFNLFNHPNLGQPSGCVDCGTSSGLITDITPTASGSTMRALQFAGRVYVLTASNAARTDSGSPGTILAHSHSACHESAAMAMRRTFWLGLLFFCLGAASSGYAARACGAGMPAAFPLTRRGRPEDCA